MRQDGLDCRGYRSLFSNVQLQEKRITALLAQQREHGFAFRRTATRRDHAGASLRERQCRRSADTGCRPGHKRHFACEHAHILHSPTFAFYQSTTSLALYAG